MPSISVIIPCFNQSVYLFNAIESVFMQNMAEFEIIIVDDGSTDASEAFYKELENSRYLSLYRQDNLGAAAARNLGISKATKDYIAFLDADDVWLPHKIELQLAAFRHPTVDMVFTHIEQFISPELMTEALRNKPIKNQLLPGICPSTMLIKHQALKRVGQFNEQLKLGEFIAWYLSSKMHRLESCVLDEVLVRRRIHKNNTSYRNKANRSDYLAIMHQHLKGETVCDGALPG